MEIENDNEEAIWETDSDQDTSPSVEFFRLKVSNMHKIKQGLNDIGRLKSRKYKKIITKEAKEKVEQFKEYFNSDVYPKISLYDKTYKTPEDFKNLKFGNETYHVVEKPEIGSNLIFQIGNNNNKRSPLILIGVAKTFYEATTKISYVSSALANTNPQPKTIRIRKKASTKIKNKSEENKLKLKGKYLVGLTEAEKEKLRNESCNDILTKIRKKDKKSVRRKKKYYRKNCCSIDVTVKTPNEIPNDSIKEENN